MDMSVNVPSSVKAADHAAMSMSSATWYARRTICSLPVMPFSCSLVFPRRFRVRSSCGARGRRRAVSLAEAE